MLTINTHRDSASDTVIGRGYSLEHYGIHKDTDIMNELEEGTYREGWQKNKDETFNQRWLLSFWPRWLRATNNQSLTLPWLLLQRACHYRSCFQ